MLSQLRVQTSLLQVPLRAGHRVGVSGRQLPRTQLQQAQHNGLGTARGVCVAPSLPLWQAPLGAQLSPQPGSHGPGICKPCACRSHRGTEQGPGEEAPVKGSRRHLKRKPGFPQCRVRRQEESPAAAPIPSAEEGVSSLGSGSSVPTAPLGRQPQWVCSALWLSLKKSNSKQVEKHISSMFHVLYTVRAFLPTASGKKPL